MTKIVQEDIQRIYAGLSDAERRTLSGKTVLVTGYAGSLGYLLMQFLRAYGESLEIPRVIGIDNFQFGRPVWVDELRADPRFADHPAYGVAGFPSLLPAAPNRND